MHRSVWVRQNQAADLLHPGTRQNQNQNQSWVFPSSIVSATMLKTCLCFSVADKIEEAQKELKDPNGSQEGKNRLDRFCLGGLESFHTQQEESEELNMFLQQQLVPVCFPVVPLICS